MCGGHKSARILCIYTHTYGTDEKEWDGSTSQSTWSYIARLHYFLGRGDAKRSDNMYVTSHTTCIIVYGILWFWKLCIHVHVQLMYMPIIVRRGEGTQAADGKSRCAPCFVCNPDIIIMLSSVKWSLLTLLKVHRKLLGRDLDLCTVHVVLPVSE